MSNYGIPNYPHIILSFDYRGWRLQIDRDESESPTTYSVWGKYQLITAVAVPLAYSPSDAIKRAKLWVNTRIASDKNKGKV